MCSRHRHAPPAVLAALTLLIACGPGTPDTQDEDGTSGADGTHVELIYVDSDSAASERPETPADTAPEETPAVAPEPLPDAPDAADEVGGDDLLSYDADGAWAVQVGTYKTAASASRRVRELSDLGYPAYAVTHPAGQQVRVRIGYFASRGEADRFGQRFRRDHGGKYWVDRRTTETASR